MTICNLREKYPHHNFYFFKDGYEMMRAPFYHAKIKSFEVINENTIFIEM